MENWDWLLGGSLVAIAGFTRGFSGFGSAMILSPGLSLLFKPQQVVATVILLEMTAAAGLIPEAIPKTKWQQVLPMALAAALMVPVGAFLLSLLDPGLMRRIIGGLIVGFVLILLTGKQYYTSPRVSISSGVGAFSGLLIGLTGMGGPPIVLYQLSGGNTSAANRANFISFFAITQLIALLSFWASGILSISALHYFIRFLPFFLIGLAFGKFLFKKVNELWFRRFILGLLFMIGILALLA